MADIPGLIEARRQGRGLGIRFLRHIERTRVLCFLIDVLSPDPRAEYEALKQAPAWSPALLDLPRVVAWSKADLSEPPAGSDFADAAATHVISSVTGRGLNALVNDLWTRVRETRRDDTRPEPPTARSRGSDATIRGIRCSSRRSRIPVFAVGAGRCVAPRCDDGGGRRGPQGDSPRTGDGRAVGGRAGGGRDRGRQRMRDRHRRCRASRRARGRRRDDRRSRGRSRCVGPPSNRHLAARIVREGAASQASMATGFRSGAGRSRAAIGSSPGSHASWSSLRRPALGRADHRALALAAGREVLVVPGHPLQEAYAGSNALLRDNETGPGRLRRGN